ncbi:hypothetical protein tinsulaeT_24230 [Thalassotalea insulae]|uniref:YdhG-like domain-containing protein n=1 Tax=Thalassotalea insulae TaxID=2056778 RepID=A0ABQ6GT13_9GAMM|nr:DUF1801 domain-containing protein [Thalassotalea insulae]GLX79083.1 hypothetical protein tinsulaeT_24230 [Thalassotalea insulae]
MNSTEVLTANGSEQVDYKIAEVGGWRAELLTQIRTAIKAVAPEVEEDCKWRKPSNPSGVPVWSYGGIICTGESYKDKVKLTFNQGAKLSDPEKLFNASLGGNQRRAVDIYQSDEFNTEAFKALVYEAIAFNVAKTKT